MEAATKIFLGGTANNVRQKKFQADLIEHLIFFILLLPLLIFMGHNKI